MNTSSDWSDKYSTLSDKSASKEFGLTQEEIIGAINAGKLQHRLQYIHGNPWFRLLRSEVEEFVKNEKGKRYLEKQKLETELSEVKKEIRSHTKKLKKLISRQKNLEQQLGKKGAR